MFALTLFCFSVAIGSDIADAEQPFIECENPKTIDAITYWQYFAGGEVKEIHDQGGTRKVRFRYMDPEKCFLVDLKSLDDSFSKVLGFERMFGSWMSVVVSDKSLDLSRKGLGEGTVRSNLEKITGQSFETFGQWGEWWEENGDYFVLSETKNQLVVDENAKRIGIPISAKIHEIDPEDYWFLMGGNLYERRIEQDGLVYFETNSLVWRWVRIDLKLVDNRQAIEKGYFRSLEALLYDWISIRQAIASVQGNKNFIENDPEYGRFLEQMDEQRLKNKMGIKNITGKFFKNFTDYQKWYQESKDKLVLTKDDKWLIAK